jgi:hypothetical protein
MTGKRFGLEVESVTRLACGVAAWKGAPPYEDIAAPSLLCTGRLQWRTYAVEN